jgi:NAD(P)-dependent dehydrogenase (short-subunit alcohol dehydrogenase family)
MSIRYHPRIPRRQNGAGYTLTQDLNGKVAVITGGSAGIGLAAAKRLAGEGVLVFLFARRQAELDRASAEIGPSAVAVRGDVSNLKDLDRLYDIVRERGLAGSTSSSPTPACLTLSRSGGSPRSRLTACSTSTSRA